MELVPDETIEHLASLNGPDSVAAKTRDELRRERVLVKQVFVFRLGHFYMVGPMSDAETEAIMLAAHEYAERVKGE